MTVNLTQTAKDLRRDSTDAERLLWQRLKARQLNGLKFRRQEQIGRFIADFVCYLRFWNNEILTNIEGVLEIIRTRCIEPPPHPGPLTQRGEG